MPSLTNLLPLLPALLLLTNTPIISAHGKVIQVTGNQGGNGTGLGILGGVVPGAGPNSKTELDTTVFNTGNNNCGQTIASGAIKIPSALQNSMHLSGPTLPQISLTNGSISGVWLTVTSDGAGPISAFVDPSGKGDFGGQKAVRAAVVENVPGRKGNIDRDGALAAEDRAVSREGGKDGGRGRRERRWMGRRWVRGVEKRASNVDVNSNFTIQMPDGLQCTGNVAGQANVCMVKIVNPSRAGPFGSCVAVQQANGTDAGV